MSERGLFHISKRKINILFLMLFVLFFTFACKDPKNERSEGNKKEADTDPNPVDITATLPEDLKFLWRGGCGRRVRGDWHLRDHARIPDRASRAGRRR